VRGWQKKAGPLAVAVSLLLVLSGCITPGGGQDPVSREAKPKTIGLAVYYEKVTAGDAYLVREVHEVPYTKEVARAALEELIRGRPSTPGAFRVLPSSTRVRGISIHDGLATVDFSREVLQARVGSAGELLGIQSIVDTLTEWPAIRKVSFLVDGRLDQRARDWWGHAGLYGQPFTRDLAKVYEPAIWVSEPAPGRKVRSPLAIRGSARVFEGVVNARLEDAAGTVLAAGHTVAAADASGRGDFAMSLPFTAPAGAGRLTVFAVSPKDGTEINKVVIPIIWGQDR